MSNKVDINEFMLKFREAIDKEDEATNAIITRQDPEVIDRIVAAAVRQWLTIETMLPRACGSCLFFADGGCRQGIKPMDAATCDSWSRSSIESAISDWVTMTEERTESNCNN